MITHTIRTSGLDINITARYPVTDADAMRIYSQMKADWWDSGKIRDYLMAPTKANLRRELLKLGRERLANAA